MHKSRSAIAVSLSAVLVIALGCLWWTRYEMMPTPISGAVYKLDRLTGAVYFCVVQRVG